MVKRPENWPKMLSDYLAERSAMPFKWGVNDCLKFPAKWVEMMRGEDFSAAYSDYCDEDAASAILKANRGVAGIITACLGMGTDQVLTATRGDVALVMTPLATGGIVDDTGQRIALIMQGGLIRVPLHAAKRIWRV